MNEGRQSVLGELSRSVEEYMFRRLTAADNALQRAVALGAAVEDDIIIELDGDFAQIAGVLVRDAETVKRMLEQEARAKGLLVQVEIEASGHILWDCDLPGAPWGEGRPWCLTNVIEEVALARLSARAGQ